MNGTVSITPSHRVSVRHNGRTLVLIASAGAVAAALRIGPAGLSVLWAEDGAIFLQHADRLGGLSVLFEPYAGYQHFLPRLMAALVLLLPVDRFALGINLLSCLAVGLVAALTYLFTAAITTNILVRATLAAAPVLVPSAGIEVLGSAANIHSYCLWLVPFLLLARPSDWRGAVGQGGLALLIALTEIQIVLFVPFAFIGLRERRNWLKLAGFAVGFGIQAATALLAPRAAMPGDLTPSPLAIVEGYWINAMLSLITPQMGVLRHWIMSTGWGAVAIVHGLLLIGIGLAVRSALPVVRTAMVMLLYGSIVTFALGYGVTPVPDYRHLREAGDFHDVLLRYSVISSAFLLGAIALAAGEALRFRDWRLGSIILLAIWASFAIHFHLSSTSRTGAPAWSNSVQPAVRQCQNQSTREWAISPIWPSGTNAEFSCRTLLRAL